MKKSLIFTIVFIAFCTSFSFEAKTKIISLDCVSAAIIDQDSGRILYSKNAEKILPMASTTKIITTIVALEKGKLSDKITVSKRSATIHGSTVGLKQGEKITLEELLYGLMLKSGNDCAIAIAEHIGGSVEGFVKLMNQKAIELGAFNTSFETPHGLDANKHFTTSIDLARITAFAMKKNQFSKIVSTKVISAGVTGNFNRSYNNINKLLYKIDNCDGVKTGYTGNAGKCLVASLKHNNGRFICTILNSSNRWRDAEKLMEYASKNYKYVKVFNKEEKIKVFKIYGSNQKQLLGITNKDFYLPIKQTELNSYKINVFAPSSIISPIKKDEILGNIVVYINKEEVAKIPIVSDRSILRKN